MSSSTPAQSATIYDFSHPGHKLNKQWPIMDLINTRIASAMGTALTNRLQIGLQGHAVQTTRSKYSECVSELGETSVIFQFTMAPMEGVAWFCMDISVLAAIVDGYFGGEATLTPLEEARELSRTEVRVLQHIYDELLVAVRDGWALVGAFTVASVGNIDIDRLKNSPIDQVVVNARMKLQLGGLELPCQIVYPFESLKPFDTKLARGETQKPTTQDTRFAQALQAELLNCELDIRGVLAETPITLGKLLELKAGDFIPLRDVQNVSFKTQNMPLFDARVGHSNGRVSASLSRWHLPVNN